MCERTGVGMLQRVVIMSFVLAVLAGGASAHTGAGVAGGFASGFLHPVLGWDHVVAMVAVGLWGAFLGMPAIWLLPCTVRSKNLRRAWAMQPASFTPWAMSALYPA